MIAPLVLEGTWDEIAARADEFRGCRIRVQVLTPEQQPGKQQNQGAVADEPKSYKPTPIVMTDESPADFDFYRPKGGGKRVPYRKGGRRLPTIVLEQREEESGCV